MGNRDAGKSSSGNTILGREEFDLKTSAQCVRRHGEVADRHITVIEAPGWFRNYTVEKSPERLKQEIVLSVSLCPPGPHAVLLIIRVDTRFKEGKRKALQDHLDLLSERVWSHTIVLFTRGDSLSDTSIEQHIESEGQDLQRLVDKCGNRFHVLNNLNRSDDTQIKELLEKIEETVALNYGRHFEMDGRKEAEERLDKWRLQTVSGAEGSDSRSVGSSSSGLFRSRSGAEPVFSSSRSRDSSHTSYESGAIKRHNSMELPPPNMSGDERSDTRSVGSSGSGLFRSGSGAEPVFSSSRSRDSSHTSYESGAIKRHNSMDLPPPDMSGDERSDTWSVGSSGYSSAYSSFRSRSGADSDSVFSSSRSKASSHSSGFGSLRSIPESVEHSGTRRTLAFPKIPTLFPRILKKHDKHEEDTKKT